MFTPSEPTSTFPCIAPSTHFVPSTSVEGKPTQSRISREPTYPHRKHYCICGEYLPCTARPVSQMHSNSFLLHDCYWHGCSDCRLVSVVAYVLEISTSHQRRGGAGTIKKHNYQCVNHLLPSFSPQPPFVQV